MCVQGEVCKDEILKTHLRMRGHLHSIAAHEPALKSKHPLYLHSHLPSCPAFLNGCPSSWAIHKGHVVTLMFPQLLGTLI